MSLLSLLPFSPHITPLHASTYLFAVSLFSISFLVFLNSSISFVITDLLNTHTHIGDIVGTLGFADELVAVVAAPLWGFLSDGRLGTRGVTTVGYVVIAVALVGFVNVKSVYPGLLVARMGFSVGGAAVSTMVSAILPEMTTAAGEGPSAAAAAAAGATSSASSATTLTSSCDAATAVEEGEGKQRQHRHPTGKLAGLVGLFTGLGALLALGVFLPLPTRFARNPGTTQAEAVREAYFTVAVVALIAALWCFLGLPAVRYSAGGIAAGGGGEKRMGLRWRVRNWVWTKIWGGDPEVLTAEEEDEEETTMEREGGEREVEEALLLPDVTPNSGRRPCYFGNGLSAAFQAGFKDSRIGVAYIGGFVARASSVGISLFIPLFVNHYFLSSGLCRPSSSGVSDGDSEIIKKECRKAYILAAELTGTSQLLALCFAPIFGYIVDRSPYHRNLPLIFSSLVGIVGYTLFGTLDSPQPQDHPEVFLYVSLMGISQIGAIVGSLGMLGRGVVDSGDDDDDGLGSEEEEESLLHSSSSTIAGGHSDEDGDEDEDAAFLGIRGGGGGGGREGYRSFSSLTRPALVTKQKLSKQAIKGSIAGLYSLSGAIGILSLTKLGGLGFDRIHPGVPFWGMAAFNALLAGVCAGNWAWESWRRRRAVGGG